MTDYVYSDSESRKTFEKILREKDRRQSAEALRSVGIDGRPKSLHDSDAEAGALLPEGGYSIIEPSRGGKDRAGSSAHRGVISKDEHVDHEVLIGMVEAELGYSFDETRLAFDPLAFVDEVPNYHAIRDRMVDIHEAGGNISLLADVLGINRGTLATAIWRQKQRRKGNV